MRDTEIFVSYATQDTEVAKRLKERLEAATNKGLSFFHSGDGESIPPGADWSSTMSEALRRADAVIVLASQYSERSQWVLYEIGYASAAGKPIIPILYPGYPPNRIPPLAHLQQVTIDSADSLQQVVKRISKVAGNPIDATFTAQDIDYILGKAAFENRHLPDIGAISLRSRDEIYWEIAKLVRSSGRDARIRATSTLLDPYSADDPIFDEYLKTVAEKIRESKIQGGVADYTLVMSFDIDEHGMPSQNRQQSIRKRQAAFQEAGVLDRITVYRRPEHWQIEVFILGDSDVVLGFPPHPDSSRLNHGVHISGRDFVAHVGYWFEACLRTGAAVINPTTLRVHTETAP